MNVVCELDESLDLKEKYVYANGILVGNINDNDELFQYFHDGLGSITMICDSTGEYQNLYVYDDFGNFRMMEEAGSVPNHYYYTGQERDESPSGLYNLRARYYAAGIGRFTQEDPVWQNTVRRELLPFWEYAFIYGSCTSTGGCNSGDRPIAPQDNNPYVYCVSNPVNMIDPKGLIGVPRIPATNWCGENWSGGMHKTYDKMNDKERERVLAPTIPLDYCCRDHDLCYAVCRQDNPIFWCYRLCDLDLAGCIIFNYYGSE